MNDGSIVFNTKIDSANVEKDLKDVEKKIRSAESSIAKNENAKLPFVQQAEELSKKLDEAKAKLQAMQQEMKSLRDVTLSPDVGKDDYSAATARIKEVVPDLLSQEQEVQRLQQEWEKANTKVGEYNQKIRKSKQELELCQTEAGRLRANLGKGGDLSAVFEKAGKSVDKFRKRLMRISASVFIFNAIRAGLRAVADYMGQALRTNAQYNAQLAQLKVALRAAFQPIYEYILPGLILILQFLTKIVTLFGKFLAWIMGKDYSQMVKNSQAMWNQANAIEAVGDAAKKASKSLASFDEINRLNGNDNTSIGTGTTGPDLGQLDADTGDLDGKLKNILGIALAIGAAFAAWKIAKHFTNDISKLAGIALAAGGAALYAYNWFDAFSNGIDWRNLNSMIAGMAAVAAGLALAFGQVGAGIGLLVTGFALAGLAMYELITTGELTNEALTALEVGILAVCAGLALLTGSWIPLLIAAIVGLVVAVAARGNEIQAHLQNLDTWLQGKFSQDWAQVFGPTLGAILNGFCAMFKPIWDNVRNQLNGWINFITGVFSINWSGAWNGIVEVFRSAVNIIPSIMAGVCNAVVSWVNSAVAAIRSLIASIHSVSSSYRSGSRSGFSFFANGGTLRSGWGVVGEVGPELIHMVGGQAVITPLNIPRLAQGAVLPANKPFMAMVGDQTHGTNVEAPLETIKQAVYEVIGDMEPAMMAGFEAVVQAINDKNMSVSIGDRDIGEANARYSRRMAVRRGV